MVLRIPLSGSRLPGTRVNPPPLPRAATNFSSLPVGSTRERQVGGKNAGCSKWRAPGARRRRLIYRLDLVQVDGVDGEPGRTNSERGK
jgi:hypothetical protein